MSKTNSLSNIFTVIVSINNSKHYTNSKCIHLANHCNLMIWHSVCACVCVCVCVCKEERQREEYF